MITLPAIDIINAIDYRMKNLKEAVAKAIDNLPEDADKLQKAVSELISVGESRKALNRKAQYCITDAETPKVAHEVLYDIEFDGCRLISKSVSADQVDETILKLTNLDKVRVYLTGTRVDKTGDFLF